MKRGGDADSINVEGDDDADSIIGEVDGDIDSINVEGDGDAASINVERDGDADSAVVVMRRSRTTSCRAGLSVNRVQQCQSA